MAAHLLSACKGVWGSWREMFSRNDIDCCSGAMRLLGDAIRQAVTSRVRTLLLVVCSILLLSGQWVPPVYAHDDTTPLSWSLGYQNTCDDFEYTCVPIEDPHEGWT